MRCEKVDLLEILKRINNFQPDQFSTRKFRPLICDNVQVGTISEEVLKILRGYPDVFIITETMVTFSNKLQGFNQRSQALNNVLLDLCLDPRFPCLKGWRDECYQISQTYGSTPLFQVERSAAPIFGIRKYGVQINGFVRDLNRGILLWLQRRSLTKQTYPGLIDNFVGGGLTEGRSVLETAVKESEEEAGLPTTLAQGLTPCGSISYLHQSERGIHPLTEFVFDLELPPTFIPENQDGEVDEWILCPLDNIHDIIRSKDFKLTSAPVIIDFMIRHGYLNIENQKNLPRIVEMLHTPLH